MTLLTNPLSLKMAILLLSSGFAFVMALVLIRSLRRSLDAETSLPQAAASAEMMAAIHSHMKQRLSDMAPDAKQPNQTIGRFSADKSKAEAASSHS